MSARLCLLKRKVVYFSVILHCHYRSQVCVSILHIMESTHIYYCCNKYLILLILHTTIPTIAFPKFNCVYIIQLNHLSILAKDKNILVSLNERNHFVYLTAHPDRQFLLFIIQYYRQNPRIKVYFSMTLGTAVSVSPDKYRSAYSKSQNYTNNC